MDRYILLISLICIYALTLVNLLIFLITLILKIRDKLKKYRYQKAYNNIYPYVKEYLEDEAKPSRRLRSLQGRLEKQIALEILIEKAKESEKKMIDEFENLGYLDLIIKNAQRRLTLETVKKLGIIGSNKAFEVLKKGVNSKDYELRYHCYYGLSMLSLNKEQVELYIKLLLTSGIMRDRLIEMINNLSLSKFEYIEFLKKQETELGKVVFLRVLENKLCINDEYISDELTKYLFDTKEVKIATVITLSSTENSKYFSYLVELYRKEDAWEVRSAIAKSLNKLSHSEDISILKEMIYDDNWWVRFNAVEVLARKGLAGIDALIEISLNDKNDRTADLAYYMLNSSQSVNRTITEHKEEYNG